MDELTYVMAESNRRARRGRTVARLIFASTVALVIVGFALLAAAPTTSISAGPPIETLLTSPYGQLALLWLAAGLVWMWRIVRADPDPDPDARNPRHLRRP